MKKKPTRKKKTATRKTTAGRKKAAAKRTPARKKPVARKKKAAASKKPVARKKKAPAKAPPKAPAAVAAVRPPGEVKPYHQKRGEAYMSEAMHEHFRNILLDWKHDLMEEVDRTVHHMQDEAANFPDPNDRATQESEFSLELRTRDRERKLIKKIDEALTSIDGDDYGFCETCGVEIGVRRLEARPTATQCIDCKTLDEIRERQMGG